MTASGGAFDAELVSLLAGVEENSFWFRSRNELIVSTFERRFGEAKSFLEIGCGTGFVLRGMHDALPQIALTGAELSTEALEIARQRLPDVQLLELDVLTMPFEQEFDVIGAFDVLEHVEQDEAAMRAMFRAVRTGGGTVVTVPQHPRLWSALDEVAGHFRRYTKRELATKLERAGFIDVRTTSFVTLLLPAMFLSRLRHPASSKDFDLEKSLRLPGALDRTCDVLMRMERRLIEAGLRFPAGGSLLAVARRP